MRKIFNRTVSGIMVLLVLLGLLSPLVKAEDLFLDLEGLLPSKNDDRATYPVLQEPYWYYGNSWSETLSHPGFVGGRGVEYYKRFYAHSDMSVEFYVYLFSNVSSAEAYCNTEINQIKSEGGYTEVSISGTFAVVHDYGTQEIGVSWGVIRNVVFKVEVYTANIVENPTDQLVSFTVLEHARILEVGVIVESVSPGPSSTISASPSPSSTISASPSPSSTISASPTPSSTIPEFPSFIILPLFMIATLIAIIISRRKQSA
jgi:hypothetical protein